MKKIYFLAMISFLAIATVFTSCSKDDDEKTKTELLTASKWKMTAATVSPAMMGITDFFPLMEACDKDNTIKFNTDKTVVSDEGATKCDAGNPQQETDTWAFSSDESKLISKGEEMTIKNLTESELKLTMTQVDGGVTYTVTMTYKH